MKVPVEMQKYARIKSIILGVLSIGFITLFVWRYVAGLKQRDEPNFWVWFGIFFPVYMMMGLMPIGKIYAVSGNNEIERYVRVGWKKFNLTKFPRPTRDQIQIRQDAERYYCLMLTYDNGNEILLGRYPVLKEADEWLTRFRSLCIDA